MELFQEGARERPSARDGVGRGAFDHTGLERSSRSRVVELDAHVADDRGMPRADPRVGQRLQRRGEVVDELERLAQAALDRAVVPAEGHADLGRDRPQRHFAFLYRARAVLGSLERDAHRGGELNDAGRLELGQRPLALDERGDGVGEDGILPIVEDGRSIRHAHMLPWTSDIARRLSTGDRLPWRHPRRKAPMRETRPEFALVAAVAGAHERGFDGIRIVANSYATGHWRCRVTVPDPGQDDEQNALLAYSSAGRWDLFDDGRTDWTVDAITDRLIELAQPFASASVADPAYVAWLAELRRRTGGGAFVMFEDAYSPEQMWRQRGLVSLLYANAEARRRDAERPGAGAVDKNGWTLDGTMPVPPPR